MTTGDYYLGTTRSVGIKQLKARLSEYLRLVRTGETVLITARDEVVAELRPVRRQAPAALSIEERLGLGRVGRAHPPEPPEGRLDLDGQGARPAARHGRAVARRGPPRSALTRLPPPSCISTRRRSSGRPSRPEPSRKSSGGSVRRASSSPRAWPWWGRAERDLTAIWARCELWEITRRVCDLARDRPVRALDAMHLATFLLARRQLAGLELLTVADRLQALTER